MVNHGRHIVRPEIEVKLFNHAIVPWQDVINIFARNATVTRCGTFPSPGGWMWYNFWWAFCVLLLEQNAWLSAHACDSAKLQCEL